MVGDECPLPGPFELLLRPQKASPLFVSQCPQMRNGNVSRVLLKIGEMSRLTGH